MSAPSAPRRFLVLALVALALGLAYAFVLTRLRPGAPNEPVLAAAADSPDRFSEVAPFTLTDSTGRTVTRESLLGKPWVAGFVFTRCTGPCPLITRNMKVVSDRLAGVDARLVTVSVDPAYDTPEVLARYAQDVGADTSRWWFLTGTVEAVETLSSKSFLLPIDRDAAQPVGQSVTHKTWLTVVDAHGRIRGYYNGETDEGVARAVDRVRFLATEK